MKDCCKNGGEDKPDKPTFKKWFNFVLYTVITAIIVGALFLQLSQD